MYKSGGSNPHKRRRDDQLVIGVVGRNRAVCFVAAAPSRSALYERLAGYVAAVADVQLYPEQADRVRTLLARRSVAAAVEAYFNAVGKRWDDEWLEIRNVSLDEEAGGASCITPVAETRREREMILD